MSPLISDLALILIVAGIVTIVFKRLKQPLVLGYIVAGFLAGPHMPYVPTIHETESVEVWSQIGVIFLMFTLGLEFSFKKIVKMGMRPIFAAVLVMAFMIFVGSTVGRLFAWSASDCLFLGGMLAMSSTTIIYKAFDDLGLRTKRFAAEVLSVLILEDMLGILLMVILSASAASAKFEGGELVKSLLSLGFFLILWFVVGVYLIPQFLSRTKRLMSGETLMICAIGLCFAMVVLADKAGYSSAFGAFMMGSILAETLEAERIEHLVSPVKDLFGAVFFVSVGMLVDPQVLVDYWLPILVITLAIILGQSFLGTSAFVLAGHPLKTAMRCGFSLAQIGEFAFILAALGQSLGVTSQFLYPVVVAVSIVTTFLTPYMIKAAEPAYATIEKLLPAPILRRVSKSGASGDADAATTAQADAPVLQTLREAWQTYLRAVLVQTAAYVVLAIAASALCRGFLLSLCRSIFEHGGVDRTSIIHWVSNGICCLITVGILGLFLRPIVMRKNRSEAARFIMAHGLLNRLAFRLTIIVRFALAVSFIYNIVDYLCPLRYYWNVLIAIVMMLLIVHSRLVKYYSIRMQRIFTHNLARRDLQARAEAHSGPAYARRLKAHDVHMQRVVVPARSLWAGHTLLDLDFTNRDGVMVAAILRRTTASEVDVYRQNTPSATAVIYPGDILEVIGDDASIDAFITRCHTEVDTTTRAASPDEHPLHIKRFVVRATSLFCGKTLAESAISRDFHCMVVGFEDADGHIATASAQQLIERHSIIWLVGEAPDLQRLAAEM
ncbi:MAG: cation:proton antiporter [Bacteroidales bacterium]|nr:cation:proton antiporter [Bacteroidales bacterium]